jgi:hypothetical protein
VEGVAKETGKEAPSLDAVSSIILVHRVFRPLAMHLFCILYKLTAYKQLASSLKNVLPCTISVYFIIQKKKNRKKFNQGCDSSHV